MATLIASYAVHSAGADTSNLVTPSFTPGNGEVIVVKLATWDATNGMGSVSGGGQTYTTRITGPTSGFNGWVRVATAVVSGSPGSMTVTAAGSAGNSRHSMVVERWGSAQLAGTPAVNSTTFGSGTPSATITTTGANSIVSWVSTDVSSIDPATRAYLLSATEDGLWDGHVGSNGVFYFAYATVASASTVAMGMSAPGSQTWALAGVEVQNAAGSTFSADASLTGTAAVTPTAAVTRPASATLAGAGAIAGAAAVTRPVAATLTGTATISATQAVARAATASLGASASIVSAASVTRPAAALFTGTATVVAAAAVVPPGGNVTLRPDGGTTARPGTGMTARPSTGATVRP